MKPKAFESKRGEGPERVAKRNQMLNICRKARGWDRIVRTPKFTYLPKKKFRSLAPGTFGRHEETCLLQGPHHTHRDSAETNRVWPQDEKIIQVVKKEVPVRYQGSHDVAQGCLAE